MSMITEMKKAYGIEIDPCDDLAEIYDLILTRPGILIRYKKEGPEGWISMVGDRGMEEALRAMPPVEQELIEKFFLQGKTLIDISRELCLPMGLLLGHIRSVRVRLELYV